MMNFLNFPFLKRFVPSLIRRARVFFNKSIFWTEIDGIYYLINIQEKLDREFYFKKKYEENNFNFISKNKFFEKPFIFVDIGSNLGIYSLSILKNFKNCNKVLAFEPILETYNKFKLNIKKNLREKQIEALNIALSNTNETKKMKSILKNNIMQSARYEISNSGNVDVIAKVFDDLYHYNNNNIFIKCDTEGHEYEVIQGMQKNLKNNKCLIQIEILDRNFSKLNLLLNRLDYKLIKKGLDKDSYFYVK